MADRYTISYERLKKIAGCGRGQLVDILDSLGIVSERKPVVVNGKHCTRAFYTPTDVYRIQECAEMLKEKLRKKKAREEKP